MFKDATKVTVDSTHIRSSVTKGRFNFNFIFVSGEHQCEECSAQLVTVVYKADKTKFKDGSEEKTGCVFCCNDFSDLV